MKCFQTQLGITALVGGMMFSSSLENLTAHAFQQGVKNVENGNYQQAIANPDRD